MLEVRNLDLDFHIADADVKMNNLFNGEFPLVAEKANQVANSLVKMVAIINYLNFHHSLAFPVKFQIFFSAASPAFPSEIIIIYGFLKKYTCELSPLASPLEIWIILFLVHKREQQPGDRRGEAADP